MRMRPHEAAMSTLRDGVLPEGVVEAVPFDTASAIKFLTMFTGQNFGADLIAWERWFKENASEEYLKSCYDRLDVMSRRRGTKTTQ